MKIQVIQHIPSCVDGDKPKQVEVDCVTHQDELYFQRKLCQEVEWIGKWKKKDGFKYFKIEYNTMKQSLLIAYFDDEKYYVIAYLNILVE